MLFNFKRLLAHILRSELWESLCPSLPEQQNPNTHHWAAPGLSLGPGNPPWQGGVAHVWKPSPPTSLSCWSTKGTLARCGWIGSKLRPVNPACFFTRARTLVIPGKAIDFSKPTQSLPKAIFMDPYEQCDLCSHRHGMRKFSYDQVQIELLAPASTMTQVSLLSESCPGTRSHLILLSDLPLLWANSS